MPPAAMDATVAPLVGDSSLPLSAPFAAVPPLATTNAVATVAENSRWSVSRSAALYKIDGWGEPYFTVNAAGNITVRPHGMGTLPHQEIDLLKVVKKVTDHRSSGGLGLQLPLIVRFPDVLKNRLESLQAAFDLAIRSENYESHYQGVYPVKCNQDRFVVEDIMRFGSSFRFGLEAGSKPELLLAMSSLCSGNPESLLVCNGFKDAEYIYLALIARKLALNSVIVLEEEDELDIVLDVSRKLSVRPVIGMRAKLRTKHSGHFGTTSGEKGKFGLTTSQILRVVKKLKHAEMLDCLQLLHFHIGSQIPTTVLLSDGVGEAAQIYCELVRLGAKMQVFDIGGGLGVDYDGSRSGESEVSVEYGLEEFASAVVRSVRSVCDRRSVNHPIICSESGRAIVSHHSVLLFEAISTGIHETPAMASPRLQNYLGEGLAEDAGEVYQNLCSAAYAGDRAASSLYADQLKQRYVDQFKLGRVGLEQLAAIDGLCASVSKLVGTSDPIRTYHINLSVFTSIPDFWGISQLFPIVPIHRLDKRPTVKAILSDLTCDSDGKIDMFIGGEPSLPLHESEGGGGGGYYLGMFLGGAYEEALGGVHNLFGGSTVVRVSQRDGPHSFAVTRAVPGPSCADVLRVMQHEPELMFETLKQRAEEYLLNDADSDGGAMTNTALAAGILTRAFHNMPYLLPPSSSSSPLPPSISDGNGFCQSDDDDIGSGAADDDDVDWPFCYEFGESLAVL